jgi:hypothetical protein
MINLSPEKIEQIRAEWKAKQAQKDAEVKAAAEEKAKIKAEKDAYWQERLFPVVTTKKAHLCVVCGQKIPAHTKVHVYTKVYNIGEPGWSPVSSFKEYYCVKCKPIEKVQ